jgi:elongation factor Ts
MNISAQEVNKLRQQTGAGMMDCKKALIEAEGNFDQAIELLRKKGQKVSASRADRVASEGAILATTNGSKGVILELNCETDFVAKNSDFLGYGEALLQAATAHNPANTDELLGLAHNGLKLSDMMLDTVGKIGEKIEIGTYQTLESEKVITYIHPGARLGVMVGFSGTDGVAIDAIGKDIAMQIAAMSPLAVDQDGIDATIVQKEIEIGKEQARQEGKPEAMLEKIAMGKLNKFYKENTLLNQDFVKDASKTVAQFLKETNPNLKITGFRRVQLGSR